MPGSSAARARSTHLLVAVFSAVLALVAFLSIAAIAAARPHGAKTRTTLYVSPTGSDSGACSRHAPCKTIGAAVAKAAKGDTVKVERGTYDEQVTVTADISLIGVHKPVIDASGQNNGVLIKGPGANGALVRGFVIKNATFEGILAVGAARLTIEHNVVLDNDQGAKAANPTGECAPAGGVPGDCGEGLHLMSVVRSVVSNNLVTANDGGILLTDELGPTAHNVISKNRSLDNVFDCGITLASHNTSAFVNGAVQPAKGGVYGNTVTDNVADGNGTQGQGGGILLAGPGPGTAVYNNVVSDNTADDNGLAGVTLHSHAPGEDLNGNKIVDNRLRNDGLTPDSSFNETGTVGILVGSASPLTGTVIAGNRISDTHFGIWTVNVPKIKRAANRFHQVAVPLQQS
ncbi:MAG TPA: right-handed parallel beta-helix repeat-containing protein [Solirubrobacteraceae bacterium]|nr:right-handed parallel beta-helix repeat-containing protein [Solirubrobacteraceae bacterium]